MLINFQCVNKFSRAKIERALQAVERARRGGRVGRNEGKLRTYLVVTHSQHFSWEETGVPEESQQHSAER